MLATSIPVTINGNYLAKQLRRISAIQRLPLIHDTFAQLPCGPPLTLATGQRFLLNHNTKTHMGPWPGSLKDSKPNPGRGGSGGPQGSRASVSPIEYENEYVATYPFSYLIRETLARLPCGPPLTLATGRYFL